MNIIYTHYVKTVKRKGKQDPKFFNKIHGAFICLVATAIRHSLKAGAHDEKWPEFKYETVCCNL